MAAGDSTLRRDHSVGEVVGTGSLITVFTGFKPLSIKVFNRTRLSACNWTAQMPDASCQLITDSGAGTTDYTFPTTNCITPLINGFTIGTNSTLNTASDVIYWEAHK